MNLPNIGRLLFASNQPVKIEPIHSASPSPKELLNTGLPGKRFQGLKVAWNVSFEHMHCGISRTEAMVLATVEQQPQNIWITVNVEKYPDIYYCLPGSSMVVKGEVTSVVGDDIYLNDCQLEFC